jgi:3-dehydroquinate dehydratase II
VLQFDLKKCYIWHISENHTVKKIAILIINGPNLNLTGQREAQHYGTETLDGLSDIAVDLRGRYPGLEVEVFQSNHEGELIDKIQGAAASGIAGIVINPGGFTHTSVAIPDALRAVKLPAIEVHLSHIYAREEFRRHNLTAPACVGSISGLGAGGYTLAVEWLAASLSG